MKSEADLALSERSEQVEATTVNLLRFRQRVTRAEGELHREVVAIEMARKKAFAVDQPETLCIAMNRSMCRD